MRPPTDSKTGESVLFFVFSASYRFYFFEDYRYSLIYGAIDSFAGYTVKKG